MRIDPKASRISKASIYKIFHVIKALLIVIFATAMCSPHPLTLGTKPFWDREKNLF
jgi:hypothetical protein